MRTSILLALLVTAAATPALAQPTGKPGRPGRPPSATVPGAPPPATIPVPPPPIPAPVTEVQRTINAFVGTWTLDGTSTVGEAVTRFKITNKCVLTAGGTAALCTMRAPGTHRGVMEGAAIVGYDAFSKKVRYMSATSAQEFHDHACSWTSDTTLTCDKYTGGTDGHPIVEDLSFTFDAGTVTYRSTVTLANGATIVSVATGKKP